MKAGSVNIVTILLAAVIVAGGYYFLVYQPRHQAPVATIPAAETATPTMGPASTTSTPTLDETAVLIAAVKKGLVAEHGPDANTLTVTVSKVDGVYAKGMASATAGGGIWFAAKVNGTWNLVWDGNGVILCKNLTTYPNFPKAMIPECYNDQTQKTVTR